MSLITGLLQPLQLLHINYILSQTIIIDEQNSGSRFEIEHCMTGYENFPTPLSTFPVKIWSLAVVERARNVMLQVRCNGDLVIDKVCFRV